MARVNIGGRSALTASDLIAELQALLAKYGDLPVFCYCDYDWAAGTYFREKSWEGIPCFEISWDVSLPDQADYAHERGSIGG